VQIPTHACDGGKGGGFDGEGTQDYRKRSEFLLRVEMVFSGK
jgi:hypothetical protein